MPSFGFEVSQGFGIFFGQVRTLSKGKIQRLSVRDTFPLYAERCGAEFYHLPIGGGRMARRPVGVAVQEGSIIVVCDDGSVFWTADVQTVVEARGFHPWFSGASSRSKP